MTDALNQAVLRLRQQVSHFSPLTDDEWNALVPHLSILTLKKHEFLVKEGEVASQVGLVFNGFFRQFYMKDGDERTTYFFFEDQLVGGYMSCVTGQPSAVTIEALSDAICIAFPYTVLTTLFSQYDGWQLFGRRFAEYIMVALEERMAGLLMRSPEERYLELLTGNQKELLQQVSQHYIANYLGITPVSLSRIRNRVSRK